MVPRSPGAGRRSSLTDYSAFGIQVLCYQGDTNPMDITRNIETIAPTKTSALDLSGYVKIECTLTLVGERPFLETRFNLRWAKGNKIEIKVRNSQGVFVLHRTLRILDNFFDDNPKRPTLELQLGCKFALRESRPPSPGDLKIPILEPAEISDRWLVKIVGNTRIYRGNVFAWRTVNYWLQTFGLPQITFLPGDYVPPERISETGTYSGGSSIMEHVGKILYTNTRCLLWVDAQERVRVRRVDLAPTAIDFTVTPRDLIIYNRSKSEREKVAGTVRVLGVTQFHWPYVDPPPATTNTAQGDFQTTETITATTTPTSRTVTKRGTAVIAGLGSGNNNPGRIGQYEEIDVENFDGGFPEQPNPNPLFAPIPGLPNYLQSKTHTVREQRAIAGSPNLTPLQATKSSEIKYTYRTTYALLSGILVQGVEIEQVSEITRIRPEGAANLKIEQIKVEGWVKLEEGVYLYTITIIRPEDTENRRYSQTSSSIGESQPPATTFAPRTTVVKPVEMFSQAQFSYPPEAPDNEHPRDYNVGGYCDNSGYAKLLAQQLGALLIGRNEAQEIGLRPTDAWLADPHPLPVVAVAHDNLEQDLYLLDIGVLLFARRSYLGGSGIWLGRRNIATGAITPPYDIKGKALRGTAGKVLAGIKLNG
jgi:hypothetical protein